MNNIHLGSGLDSHLPEDRYRPGQGACEERSDWPGCTPDSAAPPPPVKKNMDKKCTALYSIVNYKSRII